jgi:hypothetical protein
MSVLGLGDDHSNRVTTRHPGGIEHPTTMARVVIREESAPEGRVAGVDGRTVKPALLVLALAALMSIVLPSVDSETSYRDQVDRGDIVQIAAGIRLVPTPGWDLASGALAGHTRSPVGDTATTELVDASVMLSVQAAPFAGTPAALLTRIKEIGNDLNRARGETDRYPVTTRQGVAGVAEDFVGARNQGSVVAFVFRPRGQSSRSQDQPRREGVAIVVSGPKDQIARRRDDIVGMIRSIRAGS